ncbi:hypothetical protein C8R44DRAFT_855630 [Mycena epipterygia]|nr:hypothetical protein C8R44DRAFT_855630 [Mycena epipterygia]
MPQPPLENFYGPGIAGPVTLTNPLPPGGTDQRTSHATPLMWPPGHRYAITPPAAPPRFGLPVPRDDARDSWHIDRMIILPRAVAGVVPIRIFFAPSHGPCTTGVAMTELDISRGMQDPRERIGGYIPPMAHGISEGRLIFAWPNYPNTRAYEALTLKDTPTQHVTRGALGKAVSRIFRTFITPKKYSEEYVVPPNAMAMNWKLGGRNMKHEQLRLLEVLSADGQNFFVRVGVVPPRRSNP